MKIMFAGLEAAIDLSSRSVSVLRIANKALFARICESIASGKEDRAIEPFSVWDDAGERKKANDSLIVVVNPLNLPFNHKSLLGRLHAKMKEELMIDEEFRRNMQTLSDDMNSCIANLGLQLNADYCFTIDWDLMIYLKAFGFTLEAAENLSLLDNLIRFIDLAGDMSVDEAIVFINLKTFLTENELEMLDERIVFHGIQVLMLENQLAESYSDFEEESVVDQHFIEYKATYRPERPSSLQGRICSNGFGAVTI